MTGAELEVIDGEIVEQHQPLNLFGAPDPEEVIVRAAEIAKPLAAVVRKQKLSVRISQREYVRVEGWTLLGSMLGVFPYCVWTRKLENGWEARVEARLRDGSVVGSAEAQCLYAESTWSKRDDYALRSMAQTRATSKALRQPLGFVMTLAGFEATPAEEMPRVLESGPKAASPVSDAPRGEQPSGSKPHTPTAGQITKLNVLVGQLRDQLRLKTEDVYLVLDKPQVVGEDGALHWSPLRDSLTKSEAHTLIDLLESYEKSGEPVPPWPPVLVQAILGQVEPEKHEAVLAAVAANREKHAVAPDRHVEWLKAQLSKFGELVRD